MSRRATQRERLIAGMVAVANRSGYVGANVSAVISEAGVSRPTFYEYFSDREDCFAATATDISGRLQMRARDALAATAPKDALQSAVAALLAFAASEPAQALFLMSETLGGGTRALDVRDEGISETAKLIERTLRKASADSPVPDVPVAVVLGGVHRWLAVRLRRGERTLSTSGEEMAAWLGSYGQAAKSVRWRTAKQTPAPGRSHVLPEAALRPPDPIPPGRPRLTPAEVAENHRLRIMFAAAQLAQEKGYTATTVGDIARVARVDARAFYAQFAEKQDAFMAIHELGFQEIMAVTAGAFFAADGWAERSWQGASALTGFLEENPMLTHVGFVEAYAVGRAAVQRVEDSHVAFTIFLQEGAQQASREYVPSRVAMEAIITSIFELIYRDTRANARPRPTRLRGALMQLWLTPFLGADEANKLIDSYTRSR